MHIQVNVSGSRSKPLWIKGIKNVLTSKYEYTNLTFSDDKPFVLNTRRQVIKWSTGSNYSQSFVLPKQQEQLFELVDIEHGRKLDDFTEDNAFPCVYCYQTMYMDDEYGGNLAIRRGRYYRTIEFDVIEDNVIIKSELPNTHSFNSDCRWLRPLSDKERNINTSTLLSYYGHIL